VENYPAIKNINGNELAQQFVEHAAEYNLEGSFKIFFKRRSKATSLIRHSTFVIRHSLHHALI